jgi:hypothetical protein
VGADGDRASIANETAIDVLRAGGFHMNGACDSGMVRYIRTNPTVYYGFSFRGIPDVMYLDGA